jgi:SAM-dependent methyltransferase
MGAEEQMSQTLQCWCGNADLVAFSPAYLKCQICETLVLANMPDLDNLHLHVIDDQHDFYGRGYYESHLTESYGYPGLAERARSDLPERCLHWLRTTLEYKLPPARVLELGSGTGGFVAMLRWAGFDATGLELSPWIVEFARKTFDVPMLLGPVEDQTIAPASLDVIALMDVLEHFPDPVGTMRHCLNLLKPDGILLIQTPSLPEGKSYEQMQAEYAPFLEQLKEKEHLYLFSPRSIREFFYRLGADHLAFEPAIFAHYDMFVVVSRVPLVVHPPADIERALSATPNSRLVLALLDLDDEKNKIKNKWDEAEADRAARLEVIQQLSKKWKAREEVIQQLSKKWKASEADRAARLEVIQRQGAEIGQLRHQLAQLQNQRAVRILKRLHFIKDVSPVQDGERPDSYHTIREPKHFGGVSYNSEIIENIIAGLDSFGYEVKSCEIDVADYRAYFDKAAYKEKYPNYYDFKLAEKSLEHYIAARLLDLNSNDIYIDIASEGSPVPEIYNRLFGCTTYRQDLAYPEGLHGNTIGGDAAAMPIPDGFASKMALHCSFEHFEGDSDIGFIKEANRVLRPSGAVCIVPLYLFDKYAILTDPNVSVPEKVQFEDDAIVCCDPNWGNRYGRFYDPAHLIERVHNNLNGMTMTIYKITNAKEVDPSCYVEFAALISKPQRNEQSP